MPFLRNRTLYIKLNSIIVLLCISLCCLSQKQPLWWTWYMSFYYKPLSTWFLNFVSFREIPPLTKIIKDNVIFKYFFIVLYSSSIYWGIGSYEQPYFTPHSNGDTSKVTLCTVGPYKNSFVGLRSSIMFCYSAFFWGEGVLYEQVSIVLGAHSILLR